MSVKAVFLDSDAYFVCMSHALSTPNKEVMGLCIGNVEEPQNIHIESVTIVRRSDKQKYDGVKVSPEQLVDAFKEAERLSVASGRPMRVVGWYHSHPNISVLPSDVDLSTQWSHQMLDPYFVGLIFACFFEGGNESSGRTVFACFQSIQKGSEFESVEIPIHIVPRASIGKACLESLVKLPQILCEEEQETYRKINSLENLDPITKIHNGSVFTKNLCSQMSAVSGPLLQWMEDRVEQNQREIRNLEEEKAKLLAELEKRKARAARPSEEAS